MQRKTWPEAEGYTKKNRRRRIWQKVVGTMGCVVVFITTYALILPAITQELPVYCGIEAHEHDDKCYQQILDDATRQLQCSNESLGVHAHTAACYGADGSLRCGKADYLIHSHNDLCKDADGNLICNLAELKAHTHSEECYSQDPGHSHEEACYLREQGELICELPEEEGHTHGTSCYTLGDNLVCTNQENHVHIDACYQDVLICSKEETDGHTHDENCYQTGNKLTCTLPEGEGHAHTDACYEISSQLSCGLSEDETHSHDSVCYTEQKKLTCGLQEYTAHTHDDKCYVEETTKTCTLEETEAHKHDETCYAEQRALICQEPENHVHDDSCKEKVLSCQLEEKEGHQHGDACYQWTETLICGQEEMPAAEPELTCTLKEIGVHTHSDACYNNGVLSCGKLETAEHIHGDSCFSEAEQALTCTLEEGESHTHTDMCYGTWKLVCGLEEHIHELSCYADSTADLETASVWEQTLDLDELTGVWREDVLTLAQTQLGYSESTRNYIVLEDGETVKGYTRYGAWYGDPYGDWCAMFVSFCLDYAGVEEMPLHSNCQSWIEALSHEEVGLYVPATDCEPQLGDVIFFDNNGDGVSDHVGLVAELIEATEETPAQIKTIEGNRENRVMYWTYDRDDTAIVGYGILPDQLPPEEQAAVDYVIQLIDAIPSADEIDEKIEQFEEAEDYEGEEAWLTEVYQQVAKAYHFYADLSEDQKAYVTNADKLLELEYIWSITTYAATNTIPVYQINHYYPANAYDASAYAVIMLHGGSFDELCQKDGMLDFPFNYWDVIVVEENADGNLYIAQYDTSTEDKSTYEATTANGFVLIFTNDSTHSFYLSSLDIQVGDYVSVDFAYTQYDGSNNAEYNDATAQPYGYVTFSTSAPSVDIAGANPVTVVQSASTSDFIELNLYDYYGDASASTAGKSTVNSLWKTSSGTYTGYPGFQWNGGAYAYTRTPSGSSLPGYTTLVDRNVVDNIDFGNSKITDYDFEAGSYGDKSASSQTVGYGNSDARGVINRIVYYPSLSTWGLTNRPIGLSTLQDPVNGTIFKEVLERTLNSTGYPQLKSGTYTTGTGSLDYLFSESNYATKINGDKGSIDGLFQYDETTGAYTYNSRENHAQYNASTNTFTLYNQIITPNFILYPFGNFLPFNDITDGNTASLVGYITVDGQDYGYDRTGGGSAYINKIMNRLVLDNYGYYNYNYTTDEQLYNMLQEYQTNWSKYSYNGTYWSGMKTSTMINDFFNTKATSGEAPNPSSTIDFGSGTLKTLIDKMYNIDYNVEKNFFFGMDMKMNFYQPKDGMTGKDNNNDGKFDYPMEFYFTGDDDVWVYIDNILFLDLSGIHRHVGGKIDFVNGRVYYQYLNVASGGDVSEGTAYAPYGASYTDEVQNKYYTFAEILTAGGIAEADLGKYLKKDASGNYTTFLDYSTHSFKFYYMERGSGSSVCRLNFNFPLIQQNTVTVEKQLESEVEVLGDPEFTFQVVDQATGNPFFKQHDDLDKWAYSLYDADGNAIQAVRVVNKNPDGTIKTLEVYQGNIMLLKEVDGTVTHYNDDGTIRTDGTPNPKLLTTDENGYFTLKAGQKAEFVGIAEHWGEYYVREILPDSLDEQYDEIKISGETTTETTDKVQIGTTEFVGANSTVQNSNASNSFKFTNSINEALLGSLSITKNLDASYSGDTSKDFEFNVTLDGELLPENLEYTVTNDTTSETRYIYYVYLDADGKEYIDPEDTTSLTLAYSRIKLKGGETATISNILAGTAFEVTETAASAEGYTIGYTIDGETQNASSASGTVGLDKSVAVTVNNSEIGAKLSIDVEKLMPVYGTSLRTFEFVLQQVNSESDMTAIGASMTESVSFKKENSSAQDPSQKDRTATFNLSYLPADMDGAVDGVKYFYYTITETANTNTGSSPVNYDDTVYLIKVKVTQKDDAMTAEVSALWKVEGTTKTLLDSVALNPLTVAFTNTIMRNLVITKTVVGSMEDLEKAYEFTIELANGTSNTNVSDYIYSGTLTDADGNVTTDTYELVGGKITVQLKNGEQFKLIVPYQSKWTVTEKTYEGFEVTYTIAKNSDSPGSPESGNVASGTASPSITTVAFKNSRTYVLPETGGAGTTTYTMAGLMLMLCSMAFLLYRYKKRRREAL